MEKLINEFSQEHITRSCGQRAEDLFRMGFQKFGFKVIGEDIKEFKGKKWKKSGHDLDFIFERDGIYYGCEVKNALGYIEKKELETKIEMCSFLGIVPLFIMRFAPKSYIEQVRREGGFCLLYKYQLYELSQIYLVERIKKELDLPVGCPKAIEDGTIKRFENWHMRNLV